MRENVQLTSEEGWDGLWKMTVNDEECRGKRVR